MKNSEADLSNLFGIEAHFSHNLEGFNRHKHSVYSLGDKKIIIKEFTEERFAIREKFFYETFKDLCNLPRLYFSEENIFVLDFIDSENSPNLLSAVEDWARIHSIFLGSEILENPLCANHKLRNLAYYVSRNPKLFDPDSEKLKEVLLDEERERNYQTLIHGDLYKRNILTNSQGNYYIDFEFSGKGHPVRDLSLLLLNYPILKEDFLKIYRQNISFDYEGIEEDIKKKLLGKGTQLIIGLKDLNISKEKRKEIHENLLRVMRTYL